MGPPIIVGEKEKPAAQRASDRLLAVCKKTAPGNEEALKRWTLLVLKAQVEQLEETILSLVGKNGRQRHWREMTKRLEAISDEIKGPLVGI